MAAGDGQRRLGVQDMSTTAVRHAWLPQGDHPGTPAMALLQGQLHQSEAWMAARL